MTFEELVENQGFREWVENGQATNTEYWRSELSNTDTTLVEEAAAFIQAFQLKKQTLPTTEIDFAWEQLEERITTSTPTVQMSRRLWLRRMAAAIAVLLVSVSAFFVFNKKSNKTIVKDTDFGEQLALSLQDKSSVHLNANSELSYEKKWEDGAARKVKLNGQAYFEVESLPTKANFEVETDYFTVEVLGTQFDVMSRKDKASVTLKEGKITIHFPTTQNVVAAGKMMTTQKLEMKPNQRLSLEGQQFVLSETNAERQTLWVEKKIQLDESSFQELIDVFEDYYGYKVIYNSDEINPKDFKNINGTPKFEKLGDFTKAIEVLYNIKVKKVSENTLKFVK